MPTNTEPAKSLRCPACMNHDVFRQAGTHIDPIEGKAYHIYVCGICQLEFADPMLNPGAAWYAKFSSAASYEEDAKPHFLALLRFQDGHGKTLLDIGCGPGTFLAMAEKAGYRTYGIDINTEAVAQARAKGLPNVFLGDLRSFQERHPGEKFDVVTYFDCIEHLDDPGKELDSICDILNPGGLLALSTPNNERPMPFGRDYFDMPPHHLTRWTKTSMAAFLGKHELDILHIDTDYLPTWEFSRHCVNFLRETAIAMVRKILLPAGTPDTTTFTQLAESSDGKAIVGGAVLRSAATRRRLVRSFHQTLGALFFPVFVWLKLYYMLTRRNHGTQLFVIASPKRPT